MTKTQIITALNSFISAAGKITKSRHTSANALIVDEIYSNPVTDSDVNQTYTTKNNSFFSYSISIIKVGNIAHITGRIINTSGSNKPFQLLFSFKNNDYKPKIAFNPIKIIAISPSWTAVAKLLLTSNGLDYVDGDIQAGATYEFNFTTYITEN